MSSKNSPIGCWELIKTAEAVDASERTEMQLDESGRLIYAILEEGTWQIVLLSFRVERDMIVSNQHSAPREERTRFKLLDDTLYLEYAETTSAYRRIKSCSFPPPVH